MDILRLRKLTVRHSWHHAERREQSRPDCGATPLDHLHHVPEGPNNPVVRLARGSTQAGERVVLGLTVAWVVKLQIWSSPPQAAGAPPPAGWGGWELGWEAWWDPGWRGETAARCSAAGRQRTDALTLIGPPSWDGTPHGPWPSWTQWYC